ncbi:MAG TPA: CapA family protein [Anaerolineales bacterium]
MKLLPLLVAIIVLVTACGNASPVSPTTGPVVTLSVTQTSRQASLWIDGTVPDELRTAAASSGIPAAASRDSATMVLGVATDQTGPVSEWIYALVAPFPTIVDGVSSKQLHEVWDGTSTAEFASWPLWMSDPTFRAFASVWGDPVIEVNLAKSGDLLDAAWIGRPSWAVVPFDALEPRWKVLTVDGESPIRKDFSAGEYALKIPFSITGDGAQAAGIRLPPTNREATKLTTVLMTGTSGLVREIAYQMEVKGITYPAQDIGDWLRDADISHASHETAFDPGCPPPNPLENRFYCSDPRYIGLFDNVGLDVVELTGNHIMDNGSASLLYTLDLYRQHGIAYFGGGANLEDAQKPLLKEHNGNKIAFIGCNFGEPPQPLATSRLPGANPCVWTQFTRQVRELQQQGYVTIVTLQYKEGYSPVVMPWQSIDFRRAADAGAVIVSGSQSHVPLQMEFYSGAFIHYGLGNLFFGQMANQPPGPGLPLQPAERYEFLDRHVIYGGRYISTELLTAVLEDYARPRPMTEEERAAVLKAYFAYSGWLPLISTPAPAFTPTRYPLLKFTALPTHTPLPKATRTP